SPSSLFFFSSRRRHTRWPRDWSSDVCSSDLHGAQNRKVPTHSGTRIPRPAAHGRAGPSVDTAPSDRASLENLEKVVVFWNGLFGYTVVLGVVPVIGRFCMASPDLDAPARVSHLTAAKFPCGSLRSCVSVLLAFSVALAAAMQ